MWSVYIFNFSIHIQLSGGRAAVWNHWFKQTFERHSQCATNWVLIAQSLNNPLRLKSVVKKSTVRTISEFRGQEYLVYSCLENATSTFTQGETHDYTSAWVPTMSASPPPLLQRQIWLVRDTHRSGEIAACRPAFRRIWRHLLLRRCRTWVCQRAHIWR